MRVRLSPRGPICTVVRVNECAAYVRRPFTRTVNGKEISGMTKPEAISSRAHVFLVEEGE